MAFRSIRWMKLPKIGDFGIAVPTVFAEGQGWTLGPKVARWMQRNGVNEAWFQCRKTDGQWVWSHGCVELKDGKAVVTQIG